MKAIQITEYGEPEVLKLTEVEVPAIEPDDVLVEVHAAGFNPYDAKVRMGFLKGFFPLELPAVLGCDFAGVVRKVGADVTDLKEGDEVYGMQTTLRPGAYAEYLPVKAAVTRRKPANLSFEEASSIPMAALTAWEGLVALAGVKAGDRVLVHGAAGGVGSMGVQIAKAHGAWVAATCSGANVDFVRSLGADQVIDYQTQDFAKEVANIDIVLEPIGGDVNHRSYPIMNPGGTMLVVLRADPAEETRRQKMQEDYKVTTKVVEHIIKPEALDALRDLIEAGKIRPVVSHVAPLADAAKVHAECLTGFGRTGHARGKTVLKVR